MSDATRPPLPREEFIEWVRREGEHRDDVFKTVRRKLLEQLFHAFRFDLEDRRGIGGLQNVVSGGIGEWQGEQVELLGVLAERRHASARRREHLADEEAELAVPDERDARLDQPLPIAPLEPRRGETLREPRVESAR